jgi:integrase
MHFYSGQPMHFYSGVDTFAHATGLRLRECLMKWSEVDFSARQIRKPGKGDKLVTAPITDAVRRIIFPLQGHHKVFVFTYQAARTRGGKIKGHRYPITYSGAKIAWRRLRAKAGVLDFRFHDFRHDVGTKLLRQTGNLKLVQRVLNHSDLKTTTRYAHVMDDQVAEALQQLHDSRKKSRSASRKVG